MDPGQWPTGWRTFRSTQRIPSPGVRVVRLDIRVSETSTGIRQPVTLLHRQIRMAGCGQTFRKLRRVIAGYRGGPVGDHQGTPHRVGGERAVAGAEAERRIPGKSGGRRKGQLGEIGTGNLLSGGHGMAVKQQPPGTGIGHPGDRDVVEGVAVRVLEVEVAGTEGVGIAHVQGLARILGKGGERRRIVGAGDGDLGGLVDHLLGRADGFGQVVLDQHLLLGALGQ